MIDYDLELSFRSQTSVETVKVITLFADCPFWCRKRMSVYTSHNNIAPTSPITASNFGEFNVDLRPEPPVFVGVFDAIAVTAAVAAGETLAL